MPNHTTYHTEPDKKWINQLQNGTIVIFEGEFYIVVNRFGAISLNNGESLHNALVKPVEDGTKITIEVQNNA